MQEEVAKNALVAGPLGREWVAFAADAVREIFPAGRPVRVPRTPAWVRGVVQRDGGMVTMASEELYEQVKTLRVHGSNNKYYHKVIGGNFRLDAIQAAVVLAKLKFLDQCTEKYNHYCRGLTKPHLVPNLQLVGFLF